MRLKLSYVKEIVKVMETLERSTVVRRLVWVCIVLWGSGSLLSSLASVITALAQWR